MEEKPFFFDDNINDPFFFLWSKETQNFPKDLEKMRIQAKGILYKKGKKLKTTKTRFYYLTDEYLYYKEVLYIDFFCF